jgi:hypothetical protein
LARQQAAELAKSEATGGSFTLGGNHARGGDCIDHGRIVQDHARGCSSIFDHRRIRQDHAGGAVVFDDEAGGNKTPKRAW